MLRIDRQQRVAHEAVTKRGKQAATHLRPARECGPLPVATEDRHRTAAVPSRSICLLRREIEATESAEEAGVSKEARGTEEAGGRKPAEERTETVSDTVRRTEVEVEDERGRTGTTERRDKV